MLLTIDVGNTNSVLCIFDGEDVDEHWRIATAPVRTADDLAVMLRGLLSQSERLAAAGTSSPRASTAGGSGGSSPRASTVEGSGGSSPPASTAGGSGGSARDSSAGLDGIAMCSTVPSVLHEMREMLE